MLSLADDLGGSSFSRSNDALMKPSNTSRFSEEYVPQSPDELIDLIESGMKPERFISVHLSIFRNPTLTNELKADEKIKAWRMAILDEEVILPAQVRNLIKHTVKLIEGHRDGNKKNNFATYQRGLQAVVNLNKEAKGTDNVITKLLAVKKSAQFFDLMVQKAKMADLSKIVASIRDIIRGEEYSEVVKLLEQLMEDVGEDKFDQLLARGKREHIILDMYANDLKNELDILSKQINKAIQIVSDRIASEHS